MADQGYVDALPFTRPTPTTDAERALWAAAVQVYREQRLAVSPEDAWARATDLLDAALIRPVMAAEDRLGIAHG